MNRACLILTIFLTMFSPVTKAIEPSGGSSPELVVHLLDYLAKDYGGAVKEGKVVSQSEYAEQVEFAGLVEKNSAGSDKLKSNIAFMSELGKLQELIGSKGDSAEVSILARKLQQDAIRLAEIEVAPRAWPDLSHGAKLFQSNCVSCHGASGKGDGPAGVGLDPKPANFHDPDLTWSTAPYQFYNTVRLGVPGTGMPAFSNLADEDVWALAFYLKSLPYTGSNASAGLELSLKETATLTDSAIAERMGRKKEDALTSIASIRTKSKVAAVSKEPIQVAQDLLDESVQSAAKGDFAGASEFALRAYLEGIEPIEPKMKANLPGTVEQVESLMSDFRASLSRPDTIEQISAKRAVIGSKLKEIKALFSEKRMSPGVAFWAAFSIFLREGFEAVLIIVILISILRAMNQPAATRWVHVGWSTALALGVVAWFMSGFLLSMSGLSREVLEGAISLLAVVVLLYVGFWLHRYSEMKKWRAFLEAKLKHGLTKGSYTALAIVAFMAVFREAFEVVLFLRAIWIDLEPSGQSVAGLGVLSSFVLLIGLSYVAVARSRKLPLGLLFQVCSWTMIVLALILAGKGVHSLQEAGFLPVSTLAIPFRLDLVGLYPSVQTLATQAGVLLLLGFVFVAEKRPSAARQSK